MFTVNRQTYKVSHVKIETFSGPGSTGRKHLHGSWYTNRMYQVKIC